MTEHHTPTTPSLTIDIAEFEHFLAECEGTDQEKREYLELLWQIVCEFVLMGYGVHPVQQVQNHGDQPPTMITASAMAMLTSDKQCEEVTDA